MTHHPNSKQARFNTLTGEDWRHSLTRARQHRAGTTTRIRTQLHTYMSTTPTVTDAHRALAEKINNPENYTSGGVPEADIAQWLAEHDAALTARLEAAEALVQKQREGIVILSDPTCADWHREMLSKELLALTPAHMASVIDEARTINAGHIALIESQESVIAELRERCEKHVAQWCADKETIDKKDADIARLLKDRDEWRGCAERADAKMLDEQADHNKTVDRLIACKAQRDALIAAGNELITAQDALDNHELMGINAEPFQVVKRRRNLARGDMETALKSAVSGASSSAEKQDHAPRLLTALRELERASSRVSDLGATAGPQWIKLTGAILSARSALKLTPAIDAARQPKEQP